MKYTIQDLQTDFPDEAACLVWLKGYLYPDGIFCESEKCQQVRPHHLMKTRRSFSCEYCGHHVHPTAGTIFHKSTTPLTFWFYAIYLMSATRAGISAKQLQRELGVTYKTAWRMFHQIRSMMSADNEPFVGEVEVDEMYMHPNPVKRSTAMAHNSQTVFGMVQRNGKAKAVHVKSAGERVLTPVIKENIKGGTIVYSDEARVYEKLAIHGYYHSTIKHSSNRYVDGVVHTQNVENLWSNMKRGIKGVYRHVGNNHLQAYVDEYAFRYSHRNEYQPMFWALMSQVSAK